MKIYKTVRIRIVPPTGKTLERLNYLFDTYSKIFHEVSVLMPSLDVRKTKLSAEEKRKVSLLRSINNPLYNKWRKELNIDALLHFLRLTEKEMRNIRPKYLGANAYNQFRGIALEEFCFNALNKLIKDCKVENIIELFWNEKILTEEYYIFEKGEFKKYSKYKVVDLAIGKREDKLIHPLIIISCKIWQSTNWLDEDRDLSLIHI